MIHQVCLIVASRRRKVAEPVPEFMTMDQSEILEQAKALGKHLAGSPRVKAYAESQQKLQADEQAKRLLRDYQLLADKLQKAQAEGKKVTEQDAQQLHKFEQDMACNDAIKAWMRAQSDYVDLMYRVDRSIQQGLSETLGGGRPQQQPPRHGPVPSQPFTPKIVPGSGKAEA
jgi:cell fate (sporulation/competence/biofilm development) regulator YlbF (YheA/YmcA/DUF963 family)